MEKVIFLADCIFEDNDHEMPICPNCKIDYSDCGCPGPNQGDEFIYREIDGELFASKKMKILIACEFSNTVAKEFRKLGHEVLSCDLLPNDEDQQNHYKGDVFDIINNGFDLMIAFPPCTDLAVSGAKHFKEKIKDGRQQAAIDFFLKLANANIDKIAIENPVGIMSTKFRQPDQIIEPYFFGDSYKKRTCLWLKNLPKLFHNSEPDLFNPIPSHTSKGDFIITSGGKKLPKWYSDAKTNDKLKTQKIRSKTFEGIAKAMAEQWSFGI